MPLHTREIVLGATGVLVLLLLLAHREANAVIVPVSQDRSVSASATVSFPPGDSDSQLLSASDFAPFDQTANASASSGSYSGTAQASQTSIITATSIHAYGSTSMQTVDDSTFIAGAGVSEVEIVFDVTQQAEFDLDVFLSGSFADDFGLGYGANASLTGPAGVILTVDLPQQEFYWDGFASGVLEPGRYTLEARGFAGVPSFSFFSDTSGGYQVDLWLTAVPEPGTAGLLAAGLAMFALRRRSGRR